MILLSLLVSTFTPLLVLVVKVTIDDANEAWSYVNSINRPLPLWNAISPSSPCADCTQQLDPTKVYNYTWHDTSCDGCYASISFTGSSGTLYGICETIDFYHPSPSIIYSVTLNGQNYGFSFNRCAETTYNFPIYSFDMLDPNTTSSLTITHLFGSAVLLLDYFVYEDGTPEPAPISTSALGVPTATSSSSHHLDASSVAGIVLGTIGFISSVVVCTLLASRKRSQDRTSSNPPSPGSGDRKSEPVEPGGYLNEGQQTVQGATLQIPQPMVLAWSPHPLSSGSHGYLPPTDGIFQVPPANIDTAHITLAPPHPEMA